MERIVVGFDNSAGAAAALCWAAEFARTHSCRLEAVCVMGADRMFGARSDLGRGDEEDAPLRAIENVLRRNPGDDVVIRIVSAPHRGGLTAALRSAAKGAGLLVIGQADSPRHAHLADELSTRALCPVVEISPEGRARTVGGMSKEPSF